MKKTFYTNVVFSKEKQKIFFSGIINNKRRRGYKEFVPEIFVEVKNKSEIPPNSIVFKTVKGKSAYLKKFSNVGHFYSFRKSQPKEILHSDIGFEYQFLRKTFPNEISFDTSLINIVYFDIETLRLNENDEETGFPDPWEVPKPIVSISFIHSLTKKIMVYGLKDYDTSKSLVDKDKFSLEYFKFDTEKEMLEEVLNMLSNDETYPDILCGYNSSTFDIPYIVNRCYKLFDEDFVKNKLSPIGEILLKTKRVKTVRGWEEEKTYNIKGVQHIDYLSAIKKFNILKDQSSYALNEVADTIIGDSKIDYSDFGTLQDLFFKDHQTFIDYNIKDTELLLKIEEEKSVFEIICILSFNARCLFEDTLATIKPWDSYIYNELYKDKICIPPLIIDEENTDTIEGGYVKDTLPGYYQYGAVVDASALYPTTIRDGNYCFTTIIENPTTEQKKHCSMSPMEIYFDNTKQGIIPKLLEVGINSRNETKRKMLSLKQEALLTQDNSLDKEIAFLSAKEQAIKIWNNSLYGALVSKMFRYFDINIASSITSSGRDYNKYMMSVINDYLNKISKTTDFDYIIFGDTDSCGMDFTNYVKTNIKETDTKTIIKKISNLFEEEITPLLKVASKQLQQKYNLRQNNLEYDVEVIFDGALFKAKKRYFMNKFYEDGRIYENKLNLKITGLEAVKRQLPKFLKTHFKKCYEIMLFGTNNNLIDYFNEIENDFYNTPIEQIAKVISVKDVRKIDIGEGNLSVKGDTNQLKASLNYNYLLEYHKLLGKYVRINKTDSIRILPLKKNPYGFGEIAFVSKFPTEFGLDNYINKAEQFEKLFKAPLIALLDARGWSLKKETIIQDFNF